MLNLIRLLFVIFCSSLLFKIAFILFIDTTAVCISVIYDVISLNGLVYIFTYIKKVEISPIDNTFFEPK